MQPYYYWIFKACSIISKLQEYKTPLSLICPKKLKHNTKQVKPSSVAIQFKPGNH